MISREDLLRALVHEANVCKHLFTKIPEGGMEYRPTEGQRSTFELLRYLATCGIGPIASYVEGDWKAYSQLDEEVQNMTPEEFPEIMDRQIERMQEAMNGISDQDLTTKKVMAPGAGEQVLGTAIMRTSYAWLVGYRMQLFLYIKGAGNAEINTANNWGGVDYKPKKKAEEETAS